MKNNFVIGRLCRGLKFPLVKIIGCMESSLNWSEKKIYLYCNEKEKTFLEKIENLEVKVKFLKNSELLIKIHYNWRWIKIQIKKHAAKSTHYCSKVCLEMHECSCAPYDRTEYNQLVYSSVRQIRNSLHGFLIFFFFTEAPLYLDSRKQLNY